MIFTLISSGRRSDYPQTDVQITRTPGVRVFSGGSSPSSSVRVLQSEFFNQFFTQRIIQYFQLALHIQLLERFGGSILRYAQY